MLYQSFITPFPLQPAYFLSALEQVGWVFMVTKLVTSYHIPSITVNHQPGYSPATNMDLVTTPSGHFLHPALAEQARQANKG